MSLKTFLESLDLSIEDFNAGIENITELFDGKPLTTIQKEWLYKKLKMLPRDDWFTAIDAFPNHFERMPNVKQIKDQLLTKLQTAREVRRGKIEEFYNRNNIPKCIYCNNSGLIEARPKAKAFKQVYRSSPPEGMASHAFRCNACEFAELYDLSVKSIPIWGNELTAIFNIVKGPPVDEDTKKFKEIIRLTRETDKTKILSTVLEACKVGPDKVLDKLYAKEEF